MHMFFQFMSLFVFLALAVCRQCSGPPLNVQTNFPTENCGELVQVTWSPPTTGGEVRDYLIECDSASGALTTIAPPEATSVVLGPLDLALVDYTCSVSARSDFGDRTVSAPSFRTE